MKEPSVLVGKGGHLSSSKDGFCTSEVLED